MEDIISRAKKLSTFLREKVNGLQLKHCLLCLETGCATHICSACAADLTAPKHPCPRCGISRVAPDTAPCGRCLRQPPYFDASTSAFDYSFPLNQVIGQLKYGDKRYWARALAQAALPAFEQACAHISAPVLVPVPMHKSKQRKRGFNQAELLARSLARYADVAFSNKLCKRIKASPPQTGLNRKNRRSNVKNGFAVSSKLPQQPLIIIDDVVTTGSTVDELARTLKQAGALEVYVFSIARRSMD